jgi:hypothetical protein
VFSNPIIGIIGIDHEFALLKDELVEWFVDIVFSVTGFLKTTTLDSNNLSPLQTRTERCDYITKTISSSISQDQLLMLFVGFLLQYLNGTSGRVLNINNYFSKKQ